MIGKYHIEPFEMKVQGLDRTLTDKVFAICDYYMQNKIKKHSRHIYDIYKLLPLVEMDESFKRLVEEVRAIAKIYRYFWGKMEQIMVSGTVGCYGFTTSEETALVEPCRRNSWHVQGDGMKSPATSNDFTYIPH